jgi:hypothetical protein
MKYLRKLSKGRGGAKTARPKGIVGYRPRFRYSWSDELFIRAAVKAGERAAAER